MSAAEVAAAAASWAARGSESDFKSNGFNMRLTAKPKRDLSAASVADGAADDAAGGGANGGGGGAMAEARALAGSRKRPGTEGNSEGAVGTNAGLGLS